MARHMYKRVRLPTSDAATLASFGLGCLGRRHGDKRSSFDFEKRPGARDSAFKTLNVLETGSATSSPFKRDTAVTVDVDRESSPSFRDR